MQKHYQAYPQRALKVKYREGFVIGFACGILASTAIVSFAKDPCEQNFVPECRQVSRLNVDTGELEVFYTCDYD